MGDVTNLTPKQLDELRAEARRRGRFVDPVAIHVVRGAQFHREWAEAILGRPYLGWNFVEPWEVSLLALALQAEPDRPVPASELAAREQFRAEQEARELAWTEKYQAELDAWHALRNRLPIKVTVGHNYTIGHWESGYVTGREHIVAQEDLRVGRLRREAKQVFCETPAKNAVRSRKNGGYLSPVRGVVRDDDGLDRIPTCVACLRVAHRIADQKNG